MTTETKTYRPEWDGIRPPLAIHLAEEKLREISERFRAQAASLGFHDVSALYGHIFAQQEELQRLREEQAADERAMDKALCAAGVGEDGDSLATRVEIACDALRYHNERAQREAAQREADRGVARLAALGHDFTPTTFGGDECARCGGDVRSHAPTPAPAVEAR